MCYFYLILFLFSTLILNYKKNSGKRFYLLALIQSSIGAFRSIDKFLRKTVTACNFSDRLGCNNKSETN